MKPRRKRMASPVAGSSAGGRRRGRRSVLNAFQSNLVFFFSPSQVAAQARRRAARTFRIGGLVEARAASSATRQLEVSFVVTDYCAQSIPVRYDGMLPDLFKRRQGRRRAGPARHGRRVRRRRGARQARRELHAARGRGGAEARPDGQRQARRDDPASRSGHVERMIPELGHFALILALALALVHGALPLAGAARGVADWMALGAAGGAGQFAFVALAFVCLALRPSSATISRCSTSPPTRTRALPTALPLRRGLGRRTRARCCCGSLMLAVWTLAVAPLQPPPARRRSMARVLGVMGWLSRRLPAVHAAHLEPVRRGCCRPPPTAAT